MGLLHVIHWVHELQLSNFNFELGIKKVVDNHNKSKNDVAEFGTTIDEYKWCCQVYFENSQVEFNRRLANEVVHTLTQEASSLTSLQIFISSPPCILTFDF